VRTAALSALKYFDFDRICIALASKFIDAGWHDLIKKVVPGAVSLSMHSSDERFAALNMVRDAAVNTDGWVCFCRDDAMVISGVDMGGISERCGMFHSEFVSVCTKDTDMHRSFDTYLQTGHEIQRRIDAVSALGSFFGYRAEALRDFHTEALDLPEVDIRDEWLLGWHVLDNGWEDCYIERATHVQRTDIDPHGARHLRQKCWAAACNQLEKNKTHSDRYWQNWDQQSGVAKVENFWLQDRSQRHRRDHLYSTLTEHVVPRAAGADLLDVGCGICFDKVPLEEMGFKYHGADVTDEMLRRARAKHKNVDVFYYDLLSSTPDRRWPVVLCSAVLPHLPLDKIEPAIDNLWSMTEKCLVVRVFGADLHGEDVTLIQGGYIYQQLTEKTWSRYFEALNARKMECVSGLEQSKDIRIYVLWRYRWSS
jgi:2-polyprenyl-3-methyl-5-hydroxy-6-metoxy-1,4-benzoquinol methylase